MKNYFIKEEYLNGKLAISFFGKKRKEFYDEVVSVNLVDCYTPNGYVYIDTNNYPFVAELIEKEGIGEDTGIKGYSGFCQYPLFKIFTDKLWERKDVEVDILNY